MQRRDPDPSSDTSADDTRVIDAASLEIARPDREPSGGMPDEPIEAKGPSSIPRAEAASALADVLSSETFARSKRNRELLDHLATETLEGRADGLNGTTVAQDAMGKGDDFDPASDPSVRVQMGRLRRMLASHYASAGADESVRIVLPKGSYVPHFVRMDLEPALAPKASGPGGERTVREAADATARAPSSAPLGPLPGGVERDIPAPGHRGGLRALLRLVRRRSAVAIGLVALLVVSLGAFGATFVRAPVVAADRDYPVVVVRRFENRTGDQANEALVSGFQRQFAADLQRFRTARVTLNQSPRDMAAATAGTDFTVTGAILSADDTLDAIIWLIDTQNASIAATERLTVAATGDDYLETLEEFSARLTAHVAGPRGQLARIAVSDQAVSNVLTGEGGLRAFECYVQFNAFSTNRTPERFAPVHDCLARAVERAPDDGTLLAALAWMELLGAPEAGLLDAAEIGRDTSLERAAELVDRAVAVAPGNDVAHLYHGLVNWFEGNEAVAIDSMRRSVRLNPANPQHKADYGMFLTYSGEWEKGLDLLDEAIAWDIDPPGWYFVPAYFRALLDGDLREARAIVRRGALYGDPFEPVYRVVLASLMGDRASVLRWREGAMALAAENGGDALAPLRRWLRLPAIIELMERELRALDVPVGDDTV